MEAEVVVLVVPVLVLPLSLLRLKRSVNKCCYLYNAEGNDNGTAASRSRSSRIDMARAAKSNELNGHALANIFASHTHTHTHRTYCGSLCCIL